MIIGLDGNEVIHGERAIRRYAYNLIRSIAQIQTDDLFKVLYFKFRSPAHPIPDYSSAGHVQNAAIFLPGGVIEKMWRRELGPKVEWFLGSLDLYHALGGMVPPQSNTPKVLTVHSVAHLHIPQYIDRNYQERYEAFMQKAVRNADYFICVSESMKSDFVHHYQVSEKKVKAIPLGIGEEFYLDARDAANRYVKSRFGIDRPYLLYVGGIQENKNIVGILEAFSLLKRKKGFANYQLVLAGGPPAYSRGLMDLIPSMNLAKDVVITGFLSQQTEDLTRLYQAAQLFFFPSFWEGWSSPPLEALACGTAVVASQIPPHQESLGNGDVYWVDPYDSFQMAETLEQALAEEKTVSLERKQTRVDYVRQFTWEKMARSTLDFYHQIGKK